jgi:hypothetical protein
MVGPMLGTGRHASTSCGTGTIVRRCHLLGQCMRPVDLNQCACGGSDLGVHFGVACLRWLHRTAQGASAEDVEEEAATGGGRKEAPGPGTYLLRYKKGNRELHLCRAPPAKLS